jgi:hypothetical protein
MLALWPIRRNKQIRKKLISMTIKFELNVEDHIRFNEHHYNAQTNFLQKNLRWILFIFFTAYLVYSFQKPLLEEIIDWSNWLILAIVGGFFYIMNQRVFKSRKSAIENLVEENPTLIGTRELNLAEDKIVITAKGTRFEYDYEQINNLQEDKEMIYIYFSKLDAILIPKRSIDEKNVLGFLNQKIIESKALIK